MEARGIKRIFCTSAEAATCGDALDERRHVVRTHLKLILMPVAVVGSKVGRVCSGKIEHLLPLECVVYDRFRMFTKHLSDVRGDNPNCWYSCDDYVHNVC